VTEYKQDGQSSIPGKEGAPLIPIANKSTQGLLEVKWTECEADYSMSCNKLRIGTDVLTFRYTSSWRRT